MSREALEARLLELQDELLQLQAEKALGGTPSNMGAYKATRRYCTNQDPSREQLNEHEVMNDYGGNLWCMWSTRRTMHLPRNRQGTTTSNLVHRQKEIRKKS